MRLRALLIVLSLFCTTWAVAQDDAAKAEADKKAATKSDKSKTVTYTKEDLREQVDKSAKSSSVIYNEDLKEESDAKSSVVVFTNDTLAQRYGNPDSAPSTGGGATPATESAPESGEEATKTDDASESESGMTPEERAKRISEIEAQIERLEKRTLAIKNPLLAGTVPPTEEERDKEQGMSNPDRLKGVEEQIAKLKAELQELQSGR